MGAVVLEEVTSDAVAFGDIHQIGLEADQSAGRDDGLNEHVVGIVLHVDDFRLSAGKRLKDVAEVFTGNIHVKRLHRFQKRAVFGALENDLGPGHEDLEALAAHLFDENRDLHFAAGLDLEMAGNFGLGKLEGHVRPRFSDEPVLDLACGEQLAVATRQRRRR